MKYDLNNEHFNYFKSRCEYWQSFLGLLSWKIYCKHENIGHNLADCSTNYIGRVATIRLHKKWNIPPGEKELDESALHEVCEVLLSPLFAQAKARVWDIEEYEKDHHGIIRTLEKVLICSKKP